MTNPDVEPPGPGAAASPAVERRPVFRGFVAYLRHPRPFAEHDGTRTWVASLKLLALDFLLLVVLLPLAILAEKGIDSETFTADEGLSVGELLFAAIVLAPLLEEAAFRWVLTRFVPTFAIVGGALAALTVVDPATPASFALTIPGLVVLILGIAGTRDTARARIGTAWSRWFAVPFYGLAVTFGLIHLLNYDLGSAGILDLTLAPLLVLPQVVGGLVLGYVRVRLGIWYAVANHAAFNAILSVPELFS